MSSRQKPKNKKGAAVEAPPEKPEPRTDMTVTAEVWKPRFDAIGVRIMPMPSEGYTMFVKRRLSLRVEFVELTGVGMENIYRMFRQIPDAPEFVEPPLNVPTELARMFNAWSSLAPKPEPATASSGEEPQ